MDLITKPLLGLALVAAANLSHAQSSRFKIEVSSRAQTSVYAKMDSVVRNYGRVAAGLTRHARELRQQSRGLQTRVPFSLPSTVVLTSNGQPLEPALSRLAVNSLTIAFDSSGSFVFPSAYQAELQSVFDTVVPTMNAVFGPPSTSGTVYVRNYDATIDDRDAVAGGYFVANNGSGQAEIRFPVYQNAEAAAVNFVHTLLLAYLGPDNYGWDAFQEGLVRAATMKIARTPGAMPNTLDPAQIEAVLDSTYDVGPTYDWYNQRALGGPVFIAANLKSTQLPPGGSLGGLYLLRFQMSGSAWQKALVEYPGLISALNQDVYGNPALGSDVSGLQTDCQSIMDSISGHSGSTLEGLSFHDWFRRQFILETGQTQGQKLLVEPIAISSGLSGTDFGVFAVQANYFLTALNGDETLLSGTSYPIFWDPAFNRIFPTSQEDRMDVAGGYGSVTPNFPDFFSGQAYRVVIDIPILDQVARVNLPAGAIATATNPAPNDLYGTVENAPLLLGDSLAVTVSWPGSTLGPIPVTNGAFGVNTADPTFQNAQKLTVQVVLTRNASPNTLLTRIVDKGPGPIALDLHVDGSGTYSFPNGLPAGIWMAGLPVDPFASLTPADFNLSANQLLLARYDQTLAQYRLYPDVESPKIGHGYFVRLPAAQPAFSLDGRTDPNTPTAVALKPGWNMIASPLPESVPTSSIKVIRSTGVPIDYATSAGADIGVDFFRFVQGAPDSASGLPETGSLVQATSFDPGLAYFVRVIAPEGVTMLFFPSNPSVGPFSTRNAATLATSSPGWTVQLTLGDGQRQVDAFAGGSQAATRAFDPRLDSLMPPGIGGMQIVLIEGQRMYRDIQPMNSTAKFSLRLEGLIPGLSYTIGTSLLNGRVHDIRITDERSVTRRLMPGQGFTFIASAKTQVWQVMFQGAGL